MQYRACVQGKIKKSTRGLFIWIVVEQLFNEVYMGHEHAAAAIALQLEGIQGVPVSEALLVSHMHVTAGNGSN